MKKMFKDKLKNEKGITLIALIVTLVVLSIMVTAMTSGVRTSLESRNYNNIQEELKYLEESVKLYYENNGRLPNSITGTTVTNPGALTGTFYVISGVNVGAYTDLGLDYDKFYYGKGTIGDEDIFCVETSSLDVYYLKGMEINGTRYYKLSPSNY